MDLYQAENDRYPKDYDEFMKEIIKANNIALPSSRHTRSTATTRRSTSSSCWNTKTARISQDRIVSFIDQAANFSPGTERELHGGGSVIPEANSWHSRRATARQSRRSASCAAADSGRNSPDRRRLVRGVRPDTANSAVETELGIVCGWQPAG